MDTKSSYKTHLDIPYKVEIAHKKHHLDLYIPDTPQDSRPIVIFVHGGGWRRGDRGAHFLWGRANVGRALASHGIACAVVSYRLSRVSMFTLLWFVLMVSFLLSTAVTTLYLFLSTIWTAIASLQYGSMADLVRGEFWQFSLSMQALAYLYGFCFSVILIWYYTNESTDSVNHPGHVEDVASALKWVLNNSEKYGYNKHQVFLSGHSAGAHLVSLVALDYQYIQQAGIPLKEYQDSVRGVIGISGPYNITRMCTPAGSFMKFMARQMYGIPAFGYDEEVYRQASAISHVENATNTLKLSSEQQKKKHKFAFLLLNAQKDHWLAEDAEELKDMLEQTNYFSVEHRIIRKTNHRTIATLMGHPRLDTITPVIVNFIIDTLKE